MTHTFCYQSEHPLMLTPDDVEMTGLIVAVCELRNAWRDDHETYSVRVMQAVGNVIRESEAMLDCTHDEGRDE